MKPDELLTVSEWADKYRVLTQKASAEPGQWRTSRTPYLKEIMDCLSPLSPIEKVVFIKGAQVGGTEAGNNWIGYVIDYSPGPMMCVQPTVVTAKRNSKQRIAPLIEECPRLAAKVKQARSRDSGNTVLEKDFPGGRLVMTGANSAVGLRSMPVRFLFLDEVDGYPGDVDGEGDPVALAEARTRTFARKKIFLVSTPTFEGRSKIKAAYDESDQRKYYLPCPHCGGFQDLKWSQVKWPAGKPFEAAYICEHCQKPIEEYHKTKMLAAGEWRAQKPGVGGGKIAGFHLNSLYSPLGWYSWGQAADDWEKAKGKPDKLRGLINTVLGETWKEKGEAPESKRLYERRERYPLNKVPAGGLFLTAGVDVQKDRLELEIVAWGRDKQSWSIDYRVISGETSSEVPWKELNKVLMQEWPHERGASLPIKMLAVDSGFNTQHVYNWARKHPITRVMAIKGIDSASILLGQPSAVDVTVRGRKVKRGFRVWPVGVSIAKSELYSWLRLDSPSEGEAYPPGYCHLPEYGEEYFQQITAEELVTKIVRGFRKYEWVKTRDRNEALDARVYSRAAAAAVGLDRFSEAQWDELSDEIGRVESAEQDQPEEPENDPNERPFW
ncbi:MAG: phage tail protein [Bdellovibrionales bacterium RIFOXYC1_FULL_54_43]|nr:MAG: phage tail protein [Bdellovibrionales bacterium RIFOXYC1_FULL_54_43]OFZ82702.1 MAG: phage tail protein [Bdellovibrionales bacterium RIFOXYD1_FULL_55_31]